MGAIDAFLRQGMDEVTQLPESIDLLGLLARGPQPRR